jgi:Rod binding domain-containing protein
MANDMGMGSLSAQTTMLQMGEDRMIQGMKSSKGAIDSAKIDRGAKEFEAVLVGSWLQQAEQSFATIPGADDDNQDVGKDSMMSFGVQSLASSMAASGALGIGKMIAKAMHAAADKADKTDKTAPDPVPDAGLISTPKGSKQGVTEPPR